LGPNGFVHGCGGVLKNVFKEVNAEKIDLFKIQTCVGVVEIIDSFIIGTELVSHWLYELGRKLYINLEKRERWWPRFMAYLKYFIDNYFTNKEKWNL
jgi:hypothetical protein